MKPKADDIDVYVGKNIKFFRTMRRISQMQLAATVGVSFQQIQKYERGQNRVSASRMYTFAQALDVDVNDFFRGLKAKSEKNDALMELLNNLNPESIELLRLYQKTLNKEVRASLLNVLKAYEKSN